MGDRVIVCAWPKVREAKSQGPHWKWGGGAGWGGMPVCCELGRKPEAWK